MKANVWLLRETEPETFKLDVYFNAQMTPNQSTDAKQKPSNTLIHTSMAYAGEPVEFTINMGSEVSISNNSTIVSANKVKPVGDSPSDIVRGIYKAFSLGLR